MEEITLNGRRYKLVPIEDDAVNEYLEAAKSEPSVQIPNEPGVVRNAVPKVSTYREKYKKQQLSLTDLVAQPKIFREVRQTDSDLDQFNYKGDKLFFGEGTQREY